MINMQKGKRKTGLVEPKYTQISLLFSVPLVLTD